MNFRRKIGWEFDWYGVDFLGSIALFASGFAVAPKLVFDDENKYLSVINYFESLPVITNAHLSLRYESKKNESLNGFANQIIEAKTGIFAFYDKYYTDTYELIAIPEKDIKITNLPNEIQNFLMPFTFEKIVFSKTESIDIKKFFECEERFW